MNKRSYEKHAILVFLFLPKGRSYPVRSMPIRFLGGPFFPLLPTLHVYLAGSVKNVYREKVHIACQMGTKNGGNALFLVQLVSFSLFGDCLRPA